MLEGQLDASAKGLDSDYQEAFSASSPALGQQLQSSRSGLKAAIQSYRLAARSAVDGMGPATDPLALRAGQGHLLTQLDSAWHQASVALDQLLQRPSMASSRAWPGTSARRWPCWR